MGISEWGQVNHNNFGGDMNRISMKVMCKRDDVLKELRKNRENHINIYMEAKEAYLKEAIEYIDEAFDELSDIRESLKKGEYKTLLRIDRPDFSMPTNHTYVYDTAIQMLEMHTEKTIELTSGEVRNLIQDMWDWQEQFLSVATQYSHSANSYALSKGLA
jgi:hypothetical protein